MKESQVIGALMDAFKVSYSTAKRWFDKKDDLLTSKKAVVALQDQLPPVENMYNVPKKLWSSFKTSEAKLMYNSMYSRMQDLKVMAHPDCNISKEHWDTIAHNSACIAAIEVSNAGLKDVDVLKKRLKKSSRK